MHHPAWKLLCTPAFTRQRSQLNVFCHMIKFSWLWNMYDEQWTVKIMYLLVLVLTLPVFQPLKSNKKVGSSEDEIEGEFYNFCCLYSLFSQLNKTLAMWPAKDWRAIQEGSKLSLLKKWLLSSSVYHIIIQLLQPRKVREPMARMIIVIVFLVPRATICQIIGGDHLTVQFQVCNYNLL